MATTERCAGRITVASERSGSCRGMNGGGPRALGLPEVLSGHRRAFRCVPVSSPSRSAVGGSTVMRHGVSDRPAWYFSALLAGLIPLVTWASPPDATAPATNVPAAPAARGDDSLAEADACLQQALELERRRSWTEAIKLYEQAIDKWPERPD